MRVAVAGSRRLPTGIAPRLLVSFLLNLPETARLILRRGRFSEPGVFEENVATIASIVGVPVEWREPKPEETPGRASVYRRDIEMVADADLVVLFLIDDDLEDGYSGTYHLFDKALDEQRPVYAWLVDNHGNVERWGEHDPGNTFVGLFA